MAELRAAYGERATMLDAYTAAYGRYCWPVDSLADLRLAPFHLLASEGAIHTDKDHRWHLAALARLVAADNQDAPLLLATATREVTLDDVDSVAAGSA